MIRKAVYSDIKSLIELGEHMHAESRFSVYPFDQEKVAHLFAHLIESEDGLLVVSERDGVVVGGFAGYVTELYFSRTKVAIDYGLFIEPALRGGTTAARLLMTYIDWAKSRGVEPIQAGISTGVHVEESVRLYEALGFKRAGVLLELERG